jgi:hypothetical protein
MRVYLEQYVIKTKNMKRAISLFLILLAVSVTNAQTDRKPAFYKDSLNKGLKIDLYTLFRTPKYLRIFAAYYLHSCYFVKFNIDEKGKVVNLAFNEGTPGYIQLFLEEGIMSTSGKWQPATQNGHPETSNTFLLPVTFQLDLGPKKNYWDENNYSIPSVHYMTLFGKDTTTNKVFDPVPNTPLLSCVILNPISFTCPH